MKSFMLVVVSVVLAVAISWFLMLDVNPVSFGELEALDTDLARRYMWLESKIDEVKGQLGDIAKNEDGDEAEKIATVAERLEALDSAVEQHNTNFQELIKAVNFIGAQVNEMWQGSKAQERWEKKYEEIKKQEALRKQLEAKKAA